MTLTVLQLTISSLIGRKFFQYTYRRLKIITMTKHPLISATPTTPLTADEAMSVWGSRNWDEVEILGNAKVSLQSS